MRDFSTESGLLGLDRSKRSPPLIEARGVTLDMGGKRLINGTGFAIASRRRTVILGANGAGKSLLLRMMHGLLSPTKGSVLWQGRPLDKAARSEQAMVFQRPVMLRRSVLANLRFALRMKGLRGPERARREVEALELARLTDLAHRPARVLSGGEQQRLAIARALACRPKVLFLDEPTANLDPASTHAIEDLIHAASDAGITVVMVTHDAGQARRLGQDALFVHAGLVVEAAPAETLLTAPYSAPARAWCAGRLYFEAPQPSASQNVGAV
ncbi:ATP-binding cassette domain-containing protein [Tropicimonas sp. S265A]|uniref:ATP-binding cassette domain-containing protein n=1 Tax=Tropicimonas sp. S265A TaxID=3415134 RepID=UPI003C7E7D54